MIGRGGMGEVYRARDLRLKRDVAIKTLPSGFAGDRDRIARFEREARAASALNHPNIVSVHDIGTEGGVSFIVSELVEGETLARLIQRGPLPLRKLIEVSTQICDGLAAAHTAGVIHRDLKPGNIMLTRDGRVKILDFGLARQDHAPGVDSTTMDASHPGVIMGTPGYMSPEQVRGEPTDARSDIFSFGVILYEMASGKRAFTGGSSVEVMNSILKDEPPELPPASPPALDRIIRRCIEKQPARRFQSAADLGFALHSLHIPSSLQPALREEPLKRGWRRWAGVALVAVILVAAAAIWMMLRPARPAAPPPEFTLRRLTNDSIPSNDAVISPDGKLVAYSRPQANSTNRDIWVQQSDGGSAIRITDDPADDYGPSFSPDGTHIAFRSKRQAGGIYVVPSLGGEARELVPEGNRPSFSPDGRLLMYGTDNWNQNIFVRAVSGGPPLQIAPHAHPVEAVWSPDGSRILIFGTCEPNGTIATCVATADGKDVKPNHDLDIGHGVVDFTTSIAGWVANPSRLIIANRIADAYVVMAVPVSPEGTKVTGSLQKLTSVTDPLLGVSTALDGRMVLSVSTTKGHTWGLPIDGNGRPAGALRQITEGSEGESNPVLSRDGGKLAFVSERANGVRLLYKDLSTGHEKEISTDEGGTWNGVFNKDGSGVMAGHNECVYYLPLLGGLPKKIWQMPGRTVSLWDWSPDGRTLLFFTSSQSPHMVRQLDLDSLSVAPFLNEGPQLEAWQAHFSHDGHWVAFNATVNLTSSRIYIAPFRKRAVPRSEWIPVTEGDWDDKPRFSADDKTIFFVKRGQNAPHSLWSQRLKADMRPEGKPVALYSPPDGRRVIAFDDISVGPRLIVFIQAEPTGNIWLAEPAKGTK